MSKKEAYDKATQILYKMRLQNINNIMNSYSFQLSGGMHQRVGINMAMTFKPKYTYMADKIVVMYLGNIVEIIPG